MQQDIILKANAIEKTYSKNGFKLTPISLELKANDITGLVGENGNGKTTLLNMLAGELKVDAGNIEFSFNKTGKWDDIKSQIGYISQTLKIWTGTVYQNLHLQASINQIYGQENVDYVDTLIRDLGLWTYRQLDWCELSGGYKMRFELAKVLAGKPRLLILDEPLANLDVKAQTGFLNDLKYFQQQVNYPLSIIVSSQHLYKIEEVSDYLIFLQKGQCIYNGRVNDMNLSNGLLVYEIMVLENHAVLEQLMQHQYISKFQKSGNTFLVYCQPEFSAKIFLNYLLNAHIDICTPTAISPILHANFLNNNKITM